MYSTTPSYALTERAVDAIFDLTFPFRLQFSGEAKEPEVYGKPDTQAYLIRSKYYIWEVIRSCPQPLLAPMRRIVQMTDPLTHRKYSWVLVRLL